MSAKNTKKKLMSGLIMLAAFVVVLILIFCPVFGGQNGLDYLDSLYNSISKASAYYIPGLKEQAKQFDDKKIDLTLNFKDKETALRAAALMTAAGCQASSAGKDLKVSGDLGAVLASGLADADSMFHNDGQALSKRYQGAEGRLMLYTWWSTLEAMTKAMNRIKAFAQAKFVTTVQTKAVEMAYNYYGIEPQSIGDRWVVVLISLLFYVVYTIWYGYAVMFVFEGTGYQLEH